MLQAAPKGMFSNDYVMTSHDGRLAEIDVSNWRERAEFVVDGRTYRLAREGRAGAFQLLDGDTVVARAEKPSAFSSQFNLYSGNETLVLRKLSMWSRGFGLYHGDREIGRIAPTGAFSRKAAVQLPEEWPLPVQVFVFWLVLVIWRREAAAAAAT